MLTVSLCGDLNNLWITCYFRLYFSVTCLFATKYLFTANKCLSYLSSTGKHINFAFFFYFWICTFFNNPNWLVLSILNTISKFFFFFLLSFHIFFYQNTSTFPLTLSCLYHAVIIVGRLLRMICSSAFLSPINWSLQILLMF